MINSIYVDVLKKYYDDNIINNIIDLWNAPYRKYHNINHLNDVLDNISNHFLDDKNMCLYDSCICDSFIIAAFFHDVIYNVNSNENEDRSIEYFKNVSYSIVPKNIINMVIRLINSTKYREIPNSENEKLFWLFDNNILVNGSVLELIEYEHEIFKEFQFLDYDDYKNKRINFLKKEIHLNKNIKHLIDYIKNRKIKVGVYSGSFNPFHLGHLDVFEKANKIFDKVILAYGNNPEKERTKIDIPNTLKHYQTDSYNTLITDYIYSLEKKGMDVVLVRGLRNGYDLDYESNQLSFMKELKPDIKIIYIPCDKKYEHISSSAIKGLSKFNKKLSDKYIIK